MDSYTLRANLIAGWEFGFMCGAAVTAWVFHRLGSKKQPESDAPIRFFNGKITQVDGRITENQIRET